MEKHEIKKELKAILKKIKENEVDAWQDDLEDTSPVVILDDFAKGIDDEKEVTEYNNWLEDLVKLIDKIEK